MNTRTNISGEKTRRGKWLRFNPLASLDSTTLARHLDAFEAGHLREAANIWEHLEQRDDLLRSVVAKRKKSAGRQGWVVAPLPGLSPEDLAEARRHVAALEFFYQNLECEHAVDTNERGGFKLLARQMMDAVGKRFAVHEIVWRALEGRSGNAVESGEFRLSATFRFVPLTFFENTTGKLRFLENEAATEGRELEEGAWMVTVGDGLMAASSMAWMIKHMTLNDWIQYSQKNGFPGLRGSTSAVRDSAEWIALEKSIDQLLSTGSTVHAASDQIQVTDLGGGRNVPFPQLVERMDRMIAVLWRGADLSTISRDRGYGASLQEKETCALEEDDAEMLSETLNRYVDAWVIRYLFGKQVKPLAQVKVLVTPRECTDTDLQVDAFLLKHGAPLALEETMARYGRRKAQPGEAVLATNVNSGAEKPSANAE